MTAVQAGNLFAGLAAAGGAGSEEFAELLKRPGLRIERIVSRGSASLPGFWYDQAWNEWAIVLEGSARLRFEDEAAEREMAAGDYIFIPAKRRHRVEWTSPAERTVWLAVHFE